MSLALFFLALPAALRVFFPSSNSSTSLSQSESTLFKAMQLMVKMLTSRASDPSSRRIELTRAVFPVPGEPEIYNVEHLCVSADEESKKDATNLRMVARSSSRPGISWSLSLVERRSARTRTLTGEIVGGVGGGVASESSDMPAMGVLGERLDEVEARRMEANKFR